MSKDIKKYITIYTVDGKRIYAKSHNVSFEDKFVVIKLDPDDLALNNLADTSVIKIPIHNIRYILLPPEQ